MTRFRDATLSARQHRNRHLDGVGRHRDLDEIERRQGRAAASVLASLPPVFLTVMIALNVIEPTPQLAIGCGALLIVLDVFGWRLVSGLFDRERLISGGH